MFYNILMITLTLWMMVYEVVCMINYKRVGVLKELTVEYLREGDKRNGFIEYIIVCQVTYVGWVFLAFFGSDIWAVLSILFVSVMQGLFAIKPLRRFRPIWALIDAIMCFSILAMYGSALIQKL